MVLFKDFRKVTIQRLFTNRTSLYNEKREYDHTKKDITELQIIVNKEHPSLMSSSLFFIHHISILLFKLPKIQECSPNILPSNQKSYDAFLVMPLYICLHSSFNLLYVFLSFVLIFLSYMQVFLF